MVRGDIRHIVIWIDIDDKYCLFRCDIEIIRHRSGEKRNYIRVYARQKQNYSPEVDTKVRKYFPKVSKDKRKEKKQITRGYRASDSREDVFPLDARADRHGRLRLQQRHVPR